MSRHISDIFRPESNAFKETNPEKKFFGRNSAVYVEALNEDLVPSPEKPLVNNEEEIDAADAEIRKSSRTLKKKILYEDTPVTTTKKRKDAAELERIKHILEQKDLDFRDIPYVPDEAAEDDLLIGDIIPSPKKPSRHYGIVPDLEETINKNPTLFSNFGIEAPNRVTPKKHKTHEKPSTPEKKKTHKTNKKHGGKKQRKSQKSRKNKRSYKKRQ
jgi:hypothetical protein